MLTPRGWWFLAIVLGTLLVAVSVGAPSLVLVAATLASWFLGSWLRFAWITRQVPKDLGVRRELRTAAGLVQVLWARQAATVHAELTWNGRAPLPYVLAVDRVPLLAGWQDGDPWIGGSVGRDQPLALDYRIRCPAAGKLRFDGLKVTVTDLQGFFHRSAFVRDPARFRVLPPLSEAADGSPRKKRHNQLPLLGTHRLLRPGSGSELLDLRDYIPSDPPKLIAWKISARRDRLITRELESEVPIRCTLLLDVSSSVRVGPPGANALARLVEIAAALLDTNSGMRDLTGLTLVDEHGVGRVLRPARGRRSYFAILHQLADVADLPPAPGHTDLTTLLPLGMGLAHDLYPEWLTPEVNGIPWYLPAFWYEENRWRKKLAAILANVYRLGPGGLALLYQDDDTCHRFLQRWLAEHRVAAPLLLYDEAGRSLFRFSQKADFLARAVLDGVTRGKDNELFVLLADLLDLGPDLAPLLRAVQVARARHHQLLVVCPWPFGVPLPGSSTPTTQSGVPGLQELLNRAWIERLYPAFFELRRAFGRLGVPVLAASDDDAVPQVLQRLERLRAAVRR